MLALTVTQLLHPLTGNGYQFWSGIGSDLGEATIVVALVTLLRHRNCHVRGCWRLQWHPHPEHGHPVCRKHHGEPATADLATTKGRKKP